MDQKGNSSKTVFEISELGGRTWTLRDYWKAHWQMTRTNMNTEERLGGCGAETEYRGRVRKQEKSWIIDLKKKICLMY